MSTYGEGVTPGDESPEEQPQEAGSKTGNSEGPHLFFTGPGGTRDLRNLFTYHPPTPEQIPLYERIRKAGYEFAKVVEESVPPSSERSQALSQIRGAVMWANAGVACSPQPDPGPEQPGSTAPSDRE